MEKKAIIVGASSGIGEALAIEMAKDGWILGLTARRINLLEELQERLPTISFIRYMDVEKLEDARQTLRGLIKEMNGVDCIIYNAGLGHEHPDWEMENRIVQINVAGFTMTAATAYDYFKEQGKGHFVGISSIAGTRGIGIGTAYAATKAYMSNYMRGLRHKIMRKRRKIYVTDIRPGFIETDLTAGIKDKMFWTVDAKTCAKAIYKAIKNKKQMVFVPAKWQLVYWLIRLTPDFIWNRL